MDATPVIERGNNAVVLVPPVREAVQPLIASMPKRPTMVLTLDADRAADLAAVIPDAFAVTSYARAQQKLSGDPPAVVCLGVADALALMQRSSLAPGRFASIVLAWPDQLGEAGQQSLETVMAECDREAQRVVLVTTAGPAARSLTERFAFKAMTYGFSDEGGGTNPSAGAARYVIARASALEDVRRRVVDALNPERDGDVLVVPCPASRDAAAALAARTPAMPPVIVAEPHQLAWLRSVFAPLTPLALPSLGAELEQRADALRARLAHAIESEDLDRELLLITPLLAQFDATQIAAAALRLAREVPATAAAAAATRTTPAASQAPAKLWVGIGKKDNIRPGDLVGALANEARIPADAIGKIEVRELFCLVEVKAEHAEQAVKGLAGVSMRGRRLNVRLDRGAGTKPPRRV